MTHHAPCDLFHDPDDDVSTVPDLTAVQAEVVELLGYNPERRQRPRLTVAQLATVDDVVRRWAQRLQDGSGVAGTRIHVDGDCRGLQGDSAVWQATVDEGMTA